MFSHEVELRDVFVPLEDTTFLAAGDATAANGKVLIHWNTGLLGALYGGIVRSASDWIIEFYVTECRRAWAVVSDTSVHS